MAYWFLHQLVIHVCEWVCIDGIGKYVFKVEVDCKNERREMEF